MISAAESGTACATVIHTSHLGELEWDSTCELYLPAGLPGFENERRMIPVEIPAQRPLVFLQSIGRPEVCFVALPARTICPAYELHLSEDDRAALSLDECFTPEIGLDVLCLSLLLPSGRTVEVNLDAPIVINLHNSRCVQSLAPEKTAGYRRLTQAGMWEPVC